MNSEAPAIGDECSEEKTSCKEGTKIFHDPRRAYQVVMGYAAPDFGIWTRDQMRYEYRICWDMYLMHISRRFFRQCMMAS